MIVPATKRFFDSERFGPDQLKIGDNFAIDSGLGGSWTVTFAGYCGQQSKARLRFTRKMRPDWPAKDFYFASPDAASKELYFLVPENPYFD